MRDMILRLCELAIEAGEEGDIYTVRNLNRLLAELDIDPEGTEMNYVVLTGLPLSVFYGMVADLDKTTPLDLPVLG